MGGFWLMPEPLATVVLLALFGLVVVIAPPLEARAKGFRWWLWVIPNVVGLVTVFLLPSARDSGLSAAQRAARTRYGNWTGTAQTALALTCLVGGLVRSATGWW